MTLEIGAPVVTGVAVVLSLTRTSERRGPPTWMTKSGIRVVDCDSPFVAAATTLINFGPEDTEAAAAIERSKLGFDPALTESE